MGRSQQRRSRHVTCNVQRLDAACKNHNSSYSLRDVWSGQLYLDRGQRWTNPCLFEHEFRLCRKRNPRAGFEQRVENCRTGLFGAAQTVCCRHAQWQDLPHLEHVHPY